MKSVLDRAEQVVAHLWRPFDEAKISSELILHLTKAAYLQGRKDQYDETLAEEREIEVERLWAEDQALAR